MANIQIANLAQIENQFDELSDLELEAIIGGRGEKPNITTKTEVQPDGTVVITTIITW